MSDDNAVSTESEEREPGSTHSSAQELGDITAQRLQGGLRIPEQTVGTEGDGVDYYRFTLSEAREVRLGLKLRQGEAELYLEDAGGNVLARSMAYAGYEVAVRTLLPGTYYVRVEAVGAAASEYDFRCGVLEANASFRPASDSALAYGVGGAELGMPSFGEAGYGFELSETVDGSVSGVLLGTVLAVDPNGEELSYRIVGGNGSELFALGGASGELSYVGAGEDFEGGVGTSYELTIRASDGTHTIDTTVTVTITDAAEAPAFGDGSYAFELAENADGRANGLSLGRVTATDPDGDEVRYSLTGGNELFTVDETSGELYYVGPGEDYESGVTSYEVTVRASDAAHTADTTVTVTVTDAADAPAFGEESYAFELAENVDGRVNRLSLGSVRRRTRTGTRCATACWTATIPVCSPSRRRAGNCSTSARERTLRAP